MLLWLYGFLYIWLTRGDVIAIVFNDDDSKVYLTGRADVSRFETELDLLRILMQIIRTLGELGDCDRELTPHFIVRGVFQIEPT